MNVVPASRWLKFILFLNLGFHMIAVLPSLFYLMWCRVPGSEPKHLAVRLYQRLIHRKSCYLELLVLSGYLSDPRGRGFGVTYLDGERNPYGMFEIYRDDSMSISDRLFLMSALLLRWLSLFSAAMQRFEMGKIRGGAVSGYCSLYLADLCLLAQGWKREFEIDRPLHNFNSPGRMFGRWYEPFERLDLDAYFHRQLSEAEAVLGKTSRVEYLRLLYSFSNGNFADVNRILVTLRGLEFKLLPLTEKIVNSMTAEDGSRVEPGFRKAVRRVPHEIPGMQVCHRLPEKSVEVSYFEVTESGSRRIQKDIHFPAWECASLSEALVSGIFANDVLVGGFTPRGSLIFNSDEDPRRRIFSKSRGCYKGQTELHMLDGVQVNKQDVILLPSLSENYFHFLFDTYASYLLLPEALRLNRAVLIGGNCAEIRGFQSEMFSRAGAKYVFMKGPTLGHFAIKNGIWAGNPSWNTLPRPEAIESVYRAMTAGVEPDLQRARRMVCFYRTGQRRLPRHHFESLQRFCVTRGIEMCDPAKLSINEQIQLMAETKLLIVESGAAASNAIYLPRGAVFIVLVTDFAVRECFLTIPNVRGVQLIYAYNGIEDFFTNPLHLWTEPMPSLSLNTLGQAFQLALALLSEVDSSSDLLNSGPE